MNRHLGVLWVQLELLKFYEDFPHPENSIPSIDCNPIIILCPHDCISLANSFRLHSSKVEEKKNRSVKSAAKCSQLTLIELRIVIFHIDFAFLRVFNKCSEFFTKRNARPAPPECLEQGNFLTDILTKAINQTGRGIIFFDSEVAFCAILRCKHSWSRMPWIANTIKRALQTNNKVYRRILKLCKIFDRKWPGSAWHASSYSTCVDRTLKSLNTARACFAA